MDCLGNIANMFVLKAALQMQDDSEFYREYIKSPSFTHQYKLTKLHSHPNLWGVHSFNRTECVGNLTKARIVYLLSRLAIRTEDLHENGAYRALIAETEEDSADEEYAW